MNSSIPDSEQTFIRFMSNLIMSTDQRKLQWIPNEKDSSLCAEIPEYSYVIWRGSISIWNSSGRCLGTRDYTFTPSEPRIFADLYDKAILAKPTHRTLMFLGTSERCADKEQDTLAPSDQLIWTPDVT